MSAPSDPAIPDHGNGDHRSLIPAGTASTQEIPPVRRPDAQQAAARRREAFPYRFPRDKRLLGGKYSVAENARRLLRFFYLERRLAQALGAWTLAIPEFEVKVETGRHLFCHADAAHALRQRLHEQEKTLTQIDAFRDADIDRLIEEILSASDAPELLVGIHQVAGAALATAYRHHADDTDPVTDAPTIRVLRRILLDYEPMLAWADEALAAYVAGGIDESRLTRWQWHLARLLASIGGVTGSDERSAAPEPLRSSDRPFERSTRPQRDSRFVTFANTGDYDVADGEPRFPTGSYDNLRLRFLRTQRDEVDAIEAFGTFLWDIRFRDFQAEYDLARITWDEARHTEIGHRALLAAGYGNEVRLSVAAKLALPDEQLFPDLGLEQAAAMAFPDPNVVLVERSVADPRAIFGFDDLDFVQRQPEKGLITKLEARALSLAKLGLKPDSVVWDIGAGSGSVGLEASRLCRHGHVYAIEKNEGDAANARENALRFQATNYTLRHGKAPEGLETWPDPDAVFVGGSGGELAALIDLILGRLKPNGRLVMNFVTLENLATATTALAASGATWDVTQLQASRSQPILDMHRMAAQNPIWIVSAKKSST